MWFCMDLTPFFKEKIVSHEITICDGIDIYLFIVSYRENVINLSSENLYEMLRFVIKNRALLIKLYKLV